MDWRNCKYKSRVLSSKSQNLSGKFLKLSWIFEIVSVSFFKIEFDVTKIVFTLSTMQLLKISSVDSNRSIDFRIKIFDSSSWNRFNVSWIDFKAPPANYPKRKTVLHISESWKSSSKSLAFISNSKTFLQRPDHQLRHHIEMPSISRIHFKVTEIEITVITLPS